MVMMEPSGVLAKTTLTLLWPCTPDGGLSGSGKGFENGLIHGYVHKFEDYVCGMVTLGVRFGSGRRV